MPIALTRGVTLKSVIISLILIPANCYWIMYTEMVWWGLFPTTMSLFFNAVFFLFCDYAPELVRAADKAAVGINTWRAARHLCDAFYGECYRVTRPYASPHPDDRTCFLVRYA